MKRILVCTDGSHYSEVCCRYAAWMARRMGADIEAVYVSDLRAFEMPLVADLGGSLGAQPYQNLISQIEELEKEKARLLADSVRGIIRQEGWAGDVAFHHRTGLLVDQLEPLEEGADLVMLGKRGENANLAAGHLGSTLERVVRASRKPCMVTSRSFKAPQRVLLAFDGGQSSRHALEWLIANEAFKDLELHVVTVTEDNAEDKSLERLQEAETALRKAGRTYTPQMLSGMAEDEIAAYVSRAGIDLLVMGAYGHSRIREFLIGSTTSELIRNCLVPIMLFR